MSEGRGEPEPHQPSARPARGRMAAAIAAAFAAGVLLTAAGAAWWMHGGRPTPPAPATRPAPVPPVPPPAMGRGAAEQDSLTGGWEQETPEGGAAPWRISFAQTPVGPRFELETAKASLAGLYTLNEKELPRQVDLAVRETRTRGGWMGLQEPVTVRGVFTVEGDRLTLVLGLDSLEPFERVAASVGALLEGMADGFKKGDGPLKAQAADQKALRELDGRPRPGSLAGGAGTLLLAMKRDPRLEDPLIPGTPQAQREALDRMTYPPPPGELTAAWEARGPRAALRLPGNVFMPFVRVAPGDFLLGAEGDEAASPVHKVRITKGYWLGQCEVTQAQWKAVMGVNPSNIEDDTLPVESVSWEDAELFIQRLNRTGAGRFRLPTEAEWVFACQAGDAVPGQFIAAKSAVGEYAWCFPNSDSRAHPVGTRKANAWGFHDMTGNVWEWCADWHAPDYYAVSPVADPQGPDTGSERIALGGSWRDDPAICRTLRRNWFPPTLRRDGYGFRLCAD